MTSVIGAAQSFSNTFPAKSKIEIKHAINELFTAVEAPSKFNEKFSSMAKILKENPASFKPKEVVRIIQAKNMFFNRQKSLFHSNDEACRPKGYCSDFEEALENYLKIKEHQNLDIASCLADIYLINGKPQKAVELLERNKTDESMACRRFANFALKTFNNDEVKKKAIDLLTEMANRGDKWAMSRLALAYHQMEESSDDQGVLAKKYIHDAFDEAESNPYREVKELPVALFSTNGYDESTRAELLMVAKEAWNYYIDQLHEEKKLEATVAEIDRQSEQNISPLGVNLFRKFIYDHAESGDEELKGSKFIKDFIAAGEKIEKRYDSARSRYYSDRIRLEYREGGPIAALKQEMVWEEDAEANYNVAIAYYFGKAERGLTHKENLEKAKSYWEKAKNLGCERAEKALAAIDDGSLWENLETRQKRKLEEMEELYSLPLEDKESETLFVTGKEKYEYGQKKWHERGVFWLEKGTKAAAAFIARHQTTLTEAAIAIAIITALAAVFTACVLSIVILPHLGISLTLFVGAPLLLLLGYSLFAYTSLGRLFWD